MTPERISNRYLSAVNHRQWKHIQKLEAENAELRKASDGFTLALAEVMSRLESYDVRCRAFEDAARELLADMTLDDEWGRLEIPKDHPVIVKLRALLEAARG